VLDRVLENVRTTTDARGSAMSPLDAAATTLSLIMVLTSPTSCVPCLWRVVLWSALSVASRAGRSPPSRREHFPDHSTYPELR
jgi:hypothetical protein